MKNTVGGPLLLGWGFLIRIVRQRASEINPWRGGKEHGEMGVGKNERKNAWAVGG